MAKIVLKVSIAGPSGMYPAGSVIDTVEADAFVQVGYADYYEEPKPERIETADSKQFVKRETTAKRRK